MALTQTSMVKQSLKLAWPISLQQMLVNSLSMIDVIMVSHLGDAAVGAVGMGNRVAFVIQVIVLGLAWSVGIMAAQYYGAGKTSKIRSTILIASILSWVALAPILVANFLFADTVLGWGTSDQDVIALGETYLWIVIPSLLFVAVIMIFESALRSINHVRVPMLFGVIAIALNIVLNYWLINGGLGVEALGVEGAAWATLIARIFHLALLVGVLIYIKHVLKPKRVDIAAVIKHKSAWIKIIKLGWPMMFAFGVWAVGTLVYQFIFAQMGTKELAVVSLLAPIEAIFLALFFGLASSCAIMVGQQLGADKFEMAWRTVKVFVTVGPCMALILGAVLLACQGVILSMFDDLPAETLDMAQQLFAVIALGSWLKVTSMTLAMGALRAGGDNSAVLYIDTIGMWVLSIPLTYYVAFYLNWPLLWVFITAYSEEACKAVLFVLRMQSKKWLRNLTKN